MFKHLLFLSLLSLPLASTAGQIKVKVTVDHVEYTDYELVVDSKVVVSGDDVPNGNKSFFIIDKNDRWEDQIDVTIKEGVNNILINISTKTSITT